MITRRHDLAPLGFCTIGPGLAGHETIPRILQLQPLSSGLELRTARVPGATGREPAYLSRAANV